MGNVAIESVPWAGMHAGASFGARRHRDLVVLAHRGPVRFASVGSESIVERNGGGLVTALRDIMRHVDEPRFICAASTDDDRAAAASGWHHISVGDDSSFIRMLDIDARAHHDFYAVIANPLLWFIHHGLWQRTAERVFGPRELAAWSDGYVAVNRQFARAVMDRSQVVNGSVVMVHDYHFYLVPAFVRRARPDLFVHFFVHVPWPQPDAWRLLPRRIRAQLFAGLLASDIIGLQTPSDVRNFLTCCIELFDLDVDFRTSCVRSGDHVVAVRSYPISVDEGSLREVATAPEIAAHERALAVHRAEKLIVRVDRTDPSKNIVRGFHAFDRLLDSHPELEGRVTFLALLQPSRQDVREYSDHLREIRRVVADINARHGRVGWTPIDLRLGDDMALVVAAYKCFDVFMVNSVCDGMNLVCKEALLLNERDGVLALSERAGAHDELGAIAVSLRPFDVEQQADALHRALEMPRGARRARAEIGVDIVRTNDVHNWLRRQLDDIEDLSGRTMPLQVSV